MSSVAQAGVCVRTNQLDFDDEVAFASERALYDIARGRTSGPFLLVASFTHPHDPFADAATLLGPLSRRGHRHARGGAARRSSIRIAPAAPRLRDGRRAGHGRPGPRRAPRLLRRDLLCRRNVGRLMKALEGERTADNTIVIVTRDHGEMLGERGLWYKMSFFEGASRVPLIVRARAGSRRAASARAFRWSISCRRSSISPAETRRLGSRPTGGSSCPISPGANGHDEAIGEYLAEGAIAPMVMIRRGALKFIHSPADPDQLYDLEPIPGSATISPRARACRTIAAFRAEVARRWDLARARRGCAREPAAAPPR